MTLPSEEFGEDGQDLSAVSNRDARIAGLVDAIMSTNIGRDRKSHITGEQALQIAIARTFADSFIEYDEKGNQVEGPIEEIHMICNYLMDTSISVTGHGRKDLVAILSARVADEDRDDFSKILGKVMH